jgi:aldehyde:ferredoxin oxidoreductase
MALSRKIAYIDLTSGRVATAAIPAGIRKKYIGGRGLNSYLIYNHLSRSTEPLAPGNVVVVGAGVLGGTPAAASGWAHIAARSPLTGLLASVSTGGFFAPEMRWAGFDHLVIKGKAAKPSYIYAHNGKIEIRDAAALWGKSVQDTQDALRLELGDEAVQTLCIGPAGEKLVRFASVNTRHQDSGARTGIGAVLGSKNLKAIVARGDIGIEIRYPREAIEFDRKLVRRICSTDYGKKMQRWGTNFIHGLTNDMGMARTENFRLNRLSESENIGAEGIEEYAFGMDACFGCQLHCRYRYLIEEAPFSGVYAQGPGYESQGAWGAETGCTDVNTVLTGNYLANSYGLDTLETGSLIAWAMELYGKGILTDKDTGGLKLEFGNDEAVIEMIHRIGRREGLGDILAEGGLKAAAMIGKDAEKYLLQIKGVSVLQSDERPAPGMALGSATAVSGPDLLRSRPFIDIIGLSEPEMREIYGSPYPYDGPLSSDYRDYEGKPWQVFWHELCYMAAEMLGICKYHTAFLSPDMPGFDDFSEMLRLNTGLEIPAVEIWNCADRAYTLEKLFNLREGATAEDDRLPERYLDEPVPDGPEDVSGRAIDREKFGEMLAEYYRIHGWDADGVPTGKTIQTLGLDGEPGQEL